MVAITLQSRPRQSCVAAVRRSIALAFAAPARAAARAVAAAARELTRLCLRNTDPGDKSRQSHPTALSARIRTLAGAGRTSGGEPARKTSLGAETPREPVAGPREAPPTARPTRPMPARLALVVVVVARLFGHDPPQRMHACPQRLQAQVTATDPCLGVWTIITPAAPRHRAAGTAGSGFAGQPTTARLPTTDPPSTGTTATPQLPPQPPAKPLEVSKRATQPGRSGGCSQ